MDAFATGCPYGITGFNPSPISTSTLSQSQARQYPQHALQFAGGFHQGLAEPATGALDPITVVITWASSITAAAGTRITQPLFSDLFAVGKSCSKLQHSRSPYRTSMHCKGFALAAHRSAWIHVSESTSGLPLPWPVPVIGLLVLYTSNSLMGRRPILWHRSFEHRGIPAPNAYGVLVPISRGCPPP